MQVGWLSSLPAGCIACLLHGMHAENASMEIPVTATGSTGMPKAVYHAPHGPAPSFGYFEVRAADGEGLLCMEGPRLLAGSSGGITLMVLAAFQGVLGS